MKINWLTILSFVGILNSTAASASAVTSNEVNASQIEKSHLILHGTARETLLESVIYIVADVFGINSSEITKYTTFQELGADSLSMIDISKRCQDSYNVKISDEELKLLTDVNSLYEIVHSKIQEDSKKPQK